MSQPSGLSTTPPNNPPPPPPEDPLAVVGSVPALRARLKAWAPTLGQLGASDVGRFSAVVLACVSRTPKLLECTFYSIRQAIFAAAELGLEVGGVSGEAYLVPYNTKKKLPNDQEVWVTEAQFIAGYKGYLRLAHESGIFRKIEAEVILPDDTWRDVERGPAGLTWGHTSREPKERHMMEIEREVWERGSKVRKTCEVPALRGAYAYARMRGETSDDYVTVIWKPRLEEIRTRGKAGYDGPWITDYHEMARKTALRNLYKRLPKNDRMRKLEEADQDLFVPALTAADVQGALPQASAAEPSKDRVQAKAQNVAERVAAKNQRAQQAPPAPASEPPQPTVDRHPDTGEIVPEDDGR